MGHSDGTATYDGQGKKCPNPDCGKSMAPGEHGWLCLSCGERISVNDLPPEHHFFGSPEEEANAVLD